MACFKILPNELLFELSLYLNYRDIITNCNNLRCLDPHLWINKIRYELGYSNEFIQEYVYNNNNMKTLLPINEKYLELKARNGSDFGVESYNDIIILVMYASRLPDFQLAEQLVMYFIYLSALIDERTVTRTYYVAVRGSIVAENYQLTDKLVIKARQFEQIHDINEGIITGILEKYPHGNEELFHRYRVNPSMITENMKITAYAAGGHLEELEKLGNLDHTNLLNAIHLGRTNVIDHYKLLTGFRMRSTLHELVRVGRIDLLPDMETLNNEMRTYVTLALVANGYLETVRKYEHILTKWNFLTTNMTIHYDASKIGPIACITYNHMDMLNHLYRKFGKALVEYVRFEFVFVGTNNKFYNISVQMWDYLRSNKILTKRELRKIPQSTLAIMERYNIEAYQYIMPILQ